MALEVLEGAISFCPEAYFAIDTYALGLVLWEILSRCSETQEPQVYYAPYQNVVGHNPSISQMVDCVCHRKIRPLFLQEWIKHPESFVKKLVDYKTTDSDSEVSVAQNSSTDNTDYTDSEVSVCSNSIITDYIDSEVKEKNKHLRPKRFCIFCKKSYFKLSRHQQNKHKNQIDVKEALLLPKKQRDRVFALLRRKEIVNYNRLEALKENPNYLSERKTKHTINLTKCNNCKIVVARRTFYRHKKQCQLSSYEDIQHEPLAHLETLENFQIAQTSIELLFKTKILNSFRNDNIGKLCRTDATIIEIGMQLLLKVKSKQEKEIEVYGSIRNEMRRLSHLYTLFLKENDIECKYNNSMDMFARKNFNILVRVIEIFTKKDCNDIKAGLKINLYYLIKKCAKMLENLYYRKMTDNDAKEMAKFGKTLKSWQNEIFGDAINKINMSCETKLRKPVKFPEENDLKIVRNHIIERLETLSNEFEIIDETSFITLRNCACARFTLLSARRGGEPAECF